MCINLIHIKDTVLRKNVENFLITKWHALNFPN